MPAENKPTITLDDIRYAESILLKKGQTFDEERIAFIQNLETIDLQAVPGSGKTTALLAKLLILGRKLPFADGSGILVISHTNAAVDEIKHKLQPHCPQLFEYPNFVGTIQGFVDRFLAVPYYVQTTKQKISRIDSDAYKKHLQSKLSRCLKGKDKSTYVNVRHIHKVNTDSLIKYRLGLNPLGEITLLSEIGKTEWAVIKPQGNTKKENYEDWSNEEKGAVKEYLIDLKKEVLRDGILHYDDAYYLAAHYLHKQSKVAQLIQKRFAYVFVDEMQDMEFHQYTLLERLFFDGGKAPCVFQRIGDKNQAIFSRISAATVRWEDRATVLHISGSPRLSPSIAKVVERFALEPQSVKGLNDAAIKPIIILYKDPKQVLSHYAQIIEKHIRCGVLPPYGQYHAVAWRKNDEDAGKTTLSTYHPKYSHAVAAKKSRHETLKEYLQMYNVKDETLSSIRKSIIGALLHLLELEGIKNEGRYYTETSLLKTLKESPQPNAERDFQLTLYQWCIGIVRGNTEPIAHVIRAHSLHFVQIFKPECEALGTETKAFLHEKPATTTTSITVEIPNNVFVCPTTGREIVIGTVHSVKGQTHTATLYMESFYEKEEGNYESQRFGSVITGKEQLCDRLNTLRTKKTTSKDGISQNYKRVYESAKMVYVGFSRPTHLLCFAVHADRLSAAEIDSELFEVVKI